MASIQRPADLPKELEQGYDYLQAVHHGNAAANHLFTGWASRHKMGQRAATEAVCRAWMSVNERAPRNIADATPFKKAAAALAAGADATITVTSIEAGEAVLNLKKKPEVAAIVVTQLFKHVAGLLDQVFADIGTAFKNPDDLVPWIAALAQKHEKADDLMKHLTKVKFGEDTDMLSLVDKFEVLGVGVEALGLVSVANDQVLTIAGDEHLLPPSMSADVADRMSWLVAEANRQGLESRFAANGDYALTSGLATEALPPVVVWTSIDVAQLDDWQAPLVVAVEAAGLAVGVGGGFLVVARSGEDLPDLAQLGSAPAAETAPVGEGDGVMPPLLVDPEALAALRAYQGGKIMQHNAVRDLLTRVLGGA